MSNKEIQEILNQEIKWSKEHKADLSPIFVDGFIKGLKQAKFLLERFSKLK